MISIWTAITKDRDLNRQNTQSTRLPSKYFNPKLTKKIFHKTTRHRITTSLLIEFHCKHQPTPGRIPSFRSIWSWHPPRCVLKLRIVTSEPLSDSLFAGQRGNYCGARSVPLCDWYVRDMCGMQRHLCADSGVCVDWGYLVGGWGVKE